MPLVSVGVPTYNRPEGLRRTLECITGQDISEYWTIIIEWFQQIHVSQDVNVMGTGTLILEI